MSPLLNAVDVAIIGGGVMGCAAAAFLAEYGASVVLYERSAVGAGASGRNQGIVQHPFDPMLAPLHAPTVALYRELAAADVGFSLPRVPRGLLMVAFDEAAAAGMQAAIEAQQPDLRPTFLASDALARLEPALAPGLAACRLETGYPIPPASATEGYAELARRRGARIEIGEARPWQRDGRCAGVVVAGREIPAGAVLVAAGAWTHDLEVPGWRGPHRHG